MVISKVRVAVASAPIVPKRSPWVHTASAQPATSRLISAGRASVVRSRSPPVDVARRAAGRARSRRPGTAGGRRRRSARPAARSSARTGGEAVGDHRATGYGGRTVGATGGRSAGSRRRPRRRPATAADPGPPLRRPPRASARRTPASAPSAAAERSRPAPRGRSRPRGTTTPRPAGTSVERPRGEVGVVAGGQAEVGERVAAVGVEAGRDQQPRRREALDDRRDDLVERAAGSTSPVAPAGSGMFIVVPDAGAGAGLVEPPGARVQRPLVQADEQARAGRRRRRPGCRCRGGRRSRRSAPARPASASAAAVTATLLKQAEAHRLGAAWRGGRAGARRRTPRRPRPRRSAATAVKPGAGGERGRLARRRRRRRCRRRSSRRRAAGDRVEAVEVPRRVDPLELGPRRRRAARAGSSASATPVRLGAGDRRPPAATGAPDDPAR